MDKRAKTLVSFLVCAALLVSATPFIASSWQLPAGADASDWYMTVSGVLDTDKYSLYPYEAKSLKIGFSKFGEMINSIENVGLEYGGERDPFAPPAGSSVGAIVKNIWLEGWFINITYVNIAGEMRNVWAMAQHADTKDFGNGWIRVDDDYPGSAASESGENPTCAGIFIGTTIKGNGGRKTNGTVITEPIEVLYNGPRRFVARCVNTIYDWIQLDGPETAYDLPLVQVIITIDFNKDKKEVNLFKDVKIIVPPKTLGSLPIDFFFPTEPVQYSKTKYPDVDDWFATEISPGYQGNYGQSGNISAIHNMYAGQEFTAIFVQFSNRGQWDLGKPNEYKSYVHFFTQGAQNPPYDYILPETPLPQITGKDEDVAEGLATVYDYPYALTTTIFPNYYSRHGSEPDTSRGDTFDLAQIIGYEGSATAPKYVGFAAYWPSVSDWSVEMTKWWKSLTTNDVHTIDLTTEPLCSPYIIGEWDFLLSTTPFTIDYPWMPDNYSPIKVDKQFRGVTVYGVADCHNDNVPGTGPDDEDYEYQWCDYSLPFGEGIGKGVEQLFANGFLWDKKYFDPYYYWGSVDLVPNVGRGYDDNMNGFDANYEENIIDQEVAYQLYEKFKPWDLEKSVEKWTMRWVEFGVADDELSGEDINGWIYDVIFDDTADYDYIYLEMTEDLPFYSQEYRYDGEDWVLGWKYWLDEPSPAEMGEWKAYCTFAERVLVELDPKNHPGELTLLQRGVDYLIVDGGYDDDGEEMYIVFIKNGDPTKPLEIPDGALIKVLYSTWGFGFGFDLAAEELAQAGDGFDGPMFSLGSYEWIAVGKDSHPVDSLGSAMITEAFDSLKGRPVWKGALDISEPFTPTVPSLLRKFGTGDTRAAYYYSATDHRLALKDDWSSTTAIASSNIITVGGPLANVVTEYFNEFGMAIYRGMASPYMNDFLLTSDWGATFLGHDTLNTVVDPGEEGLEGSGIGIVSTYKDINGTVGLVIYGYSGQDTYWTSKLWFNIKTVPIFLDDGNGVLDWTDVNDNGLLDPEDLTWDEKWLPKVHSYAYGWWAGGDLLLGGIDEDDQGNYKWFFMPLIWILQLENPGVTDLVIRLYYDIPNSDNPYVVDSGEFFSQEIHPVALIVEELGRISEKPQHPDP